jgi:hypothetical protein
LLSWLGLVIKQYLVDDVCERSQYRRNGWLGPGVWPRLWVIKYFSNRVMGMMVGSANSPDTHSVPFGGPNFYVFFHRKYPLPP